MKVKINTAGYFGMVCDILRTALKDDDRMDQETLFELQDKIADFALLVAQHEGREEDLIKAFPWMYREEGEIE